MDEAEESAIFKRNDSTAINFFTLELNNWTQLQRLIIEKSVEIEKMKAQRTPTAVKEIFDAFVAGNIGLKLPQIQDFFNSIFGFFNQNPQSTTHTDGTSTISPDLDTSGTDPNIPPPPTGPTIEYANVTYTEATAKTEITQRRLLAEKHQHQLTQEIQNYSNAVNKYGVGSPEANAARTRIAYEQNQVSSHLEAIKSLTIDFQKTYGYYY